MNSWYPTTLRVSDAGSTPTISAVLEYFAEDAEFHYAEIGIYEGSTALAIARARPGCTVSLFDYANTLERARPRFADFANRVSFYGNTELHLDSYNWPLMKMLAEDKTPTFDYVFLDGAHTVAVDGLAFFLCDRLMKIGGYMEFDDYEWQLRGSSLDPIRVPETAMQYTDEQIDLQQVKLIIEHLVKPDPRYVEVVPNRIYQKVA